MTQTLILGHRGAKGEAPENTLAGFAHAKTLNINGRKLDGMEFDIQLTKDDGLVVFHDSTLKRCCGERVVLKHKTTSELCQIKQHSLAAQSYPSGQKDTDGVEKMTTFPLQPISRLNDVLRHVCDYRYIELEIKTHGQKEYDRLAQALIHELADVSLSIRLTSFDTDLLAHLKQVATTHSDLTNERGLIVDKFTPKHPDAAALIVLAQQLDCVGISMHKDMLSPEAIEQIHAAGLSSTAWTVNDVATYQQLCEWGVGAVITDVPRTMLAVAL